MAGPRLGTRGLRKGKEGEDGSEPGGGGGGGTGEAEAMGRGAAAGPSGAEPRGRRPRPGAVPAQGGGSLGLRGAPTRGKGPYGGLGLCGRAGRAGMPRGWGTGRVRGGERAAARAAPRRAAERSRRGRGAGRPSSRAPLCSGPGRAAGGESPGWSGGR